ncbi:MAG: hypothetical protein PHY48_09050 [Candidatus Cloacimonetes bacterium]|jgi:hypothetical protein|nr:hypothetical protein [Candidatus Cloacimonadota bacterium]
MSKIIDINWNAFRVKFNGREQEKFEEMSYLLFCREHGRDFGIFGFMNQAGIEKEPIEQNGKRIGFQAKFFDTRVSENKSVIIDGISRAKRENPTLDTIYYYLNRDFSESSLRGIKNPKYKTKIEDHAMGLGIKIVWKAPSHFQAQLRLDSHLSIAEYFFDVNPGLVNAILSIRQHKESILSPIKTQIEYSGRVIKLDRSTTISIIENEIKVGSVLILSGEGGSGKTAIVKELLSSNHYHNAYVFKANEFSVRSINEFFSQWGKVNLHDFLQEHHNVQCLVIIDSAEKLSDIDDLSPFYEFLEAVLISKWSVVFTTRSGYYPDLVYILNQRFKSNPFKIDIPLLVIGELQRIANEYGFTLPSSERLFDLICTPYYLQVYLDYYQDIGFDQDYKGFFEEIWRIRIMGSQHTKKNIQIRRSECMLKIVGHKADSGCFYIDQNMYDNTALESLYSDDVLGFDEQISCYFIAHDVIEEIALRKLLEKKYAIKLSYGGFFESIGSSLTIRRAYRAWLLEKIESEPGQIRLLINAAVSQSSISSHWRDETLISILTSKKANEILPLIESKIIENDYELLYRLVFLLRTACKEFDNNLYIGLQLSESSEASLKYLFTRPKGQGWDFIINCIYKYRKSVKNWRIIIPLLLDWTNKYKKGRTTRYAGKIALHKYKEVISDEFPGYSFKDIEDQLISVILHSVGELTDELTDYFGSLLNSQKYRRDKLVEKLLTSLIDSVEVVKALPSYVEKLAWLYWISQPKDEEDYYGYKGYDIERDFGLSGFCEHNYHPESAFQTPVYYMLRCHPIRTIDFIIKLINHSVETYSKSERGKYVEVLKLSIEGIEFKQHIDGLLWNLYRGINGGPNILQSIHMALEKCLLELAEVDDGKAIEGICFDLLKKSKSTSITSVVVSIILAYPNKTFDLAVLLFRIPQLFIYDTRRFVADQTTVSLYSSGYETDGKDYLRDERMKTCKDEFRKQSLEHIALNYQLINYGDEAIFEQRREIVWGILDEHYDKLPPEQDQDEFDRTWRTYLARMDSRRMEVKIESQDGNRTVISLNPTIDPKLKEHNDEILSKLNDQNRYMSLKTWAESRFRDDQNRFSKYEQFNNDVNLVISETKAVVAELNNGCDDTFTLFYKNTPAYVCAVSLRDFFDLLDTNDIEFCRDVTLSYVSALVDGRINHQFYDGSEPAISTLPIIMKLYPDLRNSIKSIILRLLLHESIATKFVKQCVEDQLWSISPEDAKSILIGYIILDDGYQKYRDKAYSESVPTGQYDSRYISMVEFLDQDVVLLSRFERNDLSFEDIDVESCNLRTLITAVELLPSKMIDVGMKQFFVSVLTILAKRFYDDRNRDDHIRVHRLVNKICPMVLSAGQADAKRYITPFIDYFQFSENSNLIFSEFITIKGSALRYENFWYVWDLFFEKISDLIGNIDNNRNAGETLKYYLLAHPYWNQDAAKRHSIREKAVPFYDRVVSKMGHASVVLYSISKVLNEVGSQFQSEGVTWLSSMIIAHKYNRLERYTIEYIEIFIRRFILLNRQRVKRDRLLKNKVVCILNFLFENGSIIGFLLREETL